MTIKEALIKIENFEMTSFDIENFIVTNTGYDPMRLKKLKREVSFRKIEKKRDIDIDPEKLFKKIHVEYEKKYKDNNENDLRNEFQEIIERLNLSDDKNRRKKVGLDKIDLVHQHQNEFEEKVSEWENLIFLMSLYKLAEKHGDSVAYSFIQFYALDILEREIDWLLKHAKKETIGSESSQTPLNYQGDESAFNQPDLLTSSEAAKMFVQRKENTSGRYNEEDIEPVMRVARDFIIKNKVEDLYNQVKTVRDKCEKKGLAGSKNTKDNWIEFFAKKAGRYTERSKKKNSSAD